MVARARRPHREVRVPEDRQVLEPDGRRGELGRCAGRLPEVDDGGVRRGSLDPSRRGSAPQRVEDVVRALPRRRPPASRREITRLVQAERRVGAVLQGALQPCGAATRGHDRAAPSNRAAWTATSPTVPRRADTSTVSPPSSGARHANGSQPARPAIPSAPASAGSAPSGTSITCASPTGARSAIAPASFAQATRRRSRPPCRPPCVRPPHNPARTATRG